MTTIKYTTRFHPKKIVSVDLSSLQTSGMGTIIGKMYYNTKISELLGDMITGYPHNGGYHSLYLNGYYEDVIVAIELIRDQTPVRFHPMIIEAKSDLTMLCSKIKIMVESKK